MSARSRAGSWRDRTISVGAVLTLAAAGAAYGANPSSAAPSAAKSTPSHALSAGRYMVSFADEPAATYEGNVKGYARTRPDAGKKLDPTRDVVVKWRAHLTSVHDSALQAVGAAKLADYTVATNGFSANLTAAQARKLAATAGVTRLEKDSIRTVNFEMTPEFLGLTAANGLWAQLGDTGPSGTAGHGIIVGDIDTGIWPESPAFAGKELKRDAAGLPVPASGLRGTWFGPCVQGENFSSQACNDKLIGARYYTAGFGKKDIGKQDYLSPRDGDGHGSHTASTAAGNRVNNVVVDGRNFGVASGMAPGAKIAAYKVCWDGAPGINDGCATSDIVSAIDDAVADGVDVLNMSIGSTTESDPLATDEQAFRRAVNVGIFVANSAGNSGPGASTLDHPSPWITTVAASTFRISEAVVELGNHQRFVGASLTPRLTSRTLVSAAAVKTAAASAANATLCIGGTLDPAKAAGKIVYCDRGTNGRVEKSEEVKRAGGAGMILGNTTAPLETVADLHRIPAVHVELPARDAILAYIAAHPSDATAAIVDVNPLESSTQVPEVAGFSSRGPSTSTGGDILKPDLAAPGVDVLAAVAPPFHTGRSYDFISGTSMASPHVAGLGALLKALHPTWSPAAVKSALMTSGRDHATSADPFAQGAGFVQPNGAADPGLVFDAGPTDYRRYMVGLGVQFAPPNDTLTALSGSDLNQASIAVGSLTGTRTVTRTVKNVTAATEHYNAAATLPGMNVTINPSSFTLAGGASQALSITMTRTTATLGNWTKGNMTLTGSAHTVRVPVVARPVALSAPNEIHGTGIAGSAAYQVTPGFTGPLSTAVSGLVGATPVASSVATGPYTLDTPVENAATKKFSLTIPANTKLARFDVDATSNADDLDLYVYKDGTFVAASASGAGDEQVTLNDPGPGEYTAYVNGFATGGGGAFAYTQWKVLAAAVGNLTATGAGPVTLGVPTTLTAHWSGLDAALRYVGFIAYTGPDGLAPNRTVVSIG